MQLRSVSAAEAARTVRRLVRDVKPRCGETLMIGIDGPSGSGKTTLAQAVQAEIGGVMLQMDDLFPGWDGLAEASELLQRQVLTPMAQGRPGRYRRWNWAESAWAETVVIPWTSLLIVEGCASTVGSVADLVALPVWVEADEAVRMTRGIDRDGEAFRPHWERWAAQERKLFAADGTRARAALIVQT